MSDARWLEIDDDVASAIKHFKNAVAIRENGLSPGDDLPSYTGRGWRSCRPCRQGTRR